MRCHFSTLSTGTKSRKPSQSMPKLYYNFQPAGFVLRGAKKITIMKIIIIIIIILIIIIIIIHRQFNKRRKYLQSRRGCFHILTIMGSEYSRLYPSYQRHKYNCTCTCCYQLHLHHRHVIIILTSRRYQFTDLARIASFVSQGMMYIHNLCQRLLHN